VTVLNRTLSIKVFPQGIYNPATQLLNKTQDKERYRFESDTADLITIRLVNNSVPYNDVWSFRDICLPTSGILKVNIPSSLKTSYYLVINHRNSIETWSSTPVSFNENVIFYDFTTEANSALGSNLVQLGNSWLVFGGDINQDGSVDISDMTPVDNNTFNYISGYVGTDVNGDGQTDTGDMVIIDNNSNQYIGSIFLFSQDLPDVTTMPATNIGLTTATYSGEVTLQGSSFVTARGFCWSTSPNPTIEDCHTTQGTSTGFFTDEIRGLMMGTHYYIRAFATNNSGLAYGQQQSYSTLSPGGIGPCQGIPTVTYGGQTYNTVQIGNQCWFRENLNIGNRIDASQNQSNNNIIEKYCYNDLESNCDIYGGLYTWDEMMQYSSHENVQGICPPGWHLPSDFEWRTLTDYLGGRSIAGGKMKESGLKHWNDPNYGATNESGFTARPGGSLVTGIGSGGIGFEGWWFSSSMCYPPTPGNRMIPYDNSGIMEDVGCGKSFSNVNYSVRCILDDSLKPVSSVITSVITEITANSAKCSGDVLSSGGSQPTMRGVCWSTVHNPTIAGQHTCVSGGVGFFSSTITGLLPDSIYYIRAYATNHAGTVYGNERFFSTSTFGIPCPGLDSIFYVGKTYKTVKIGDQCWLQENLNVGTRINIQNNQTNNNLLEKYCYGDIESNCDVYGGLYQWDEMMQYSMIEGERGICPTGWHVPSDIEFSILCNFLGGENNAGAGMKEFGTATWITPNTGATNLSGFTALPAAHREFSIGEFAYFRTSTYIGFEDSWNWELSYNNTDFNHFEYFGNSEGYSVRCLLDDSLKLAKVITSDITNITGNTAQGGGNISYQGGSPVSERGVCFSTSQNPTNLDFHTSDGAGVGVFISNLVGMNPNTTYFVRAYATNTGGTAYGNEVSFTTTETGQIPIVTTSSIIGISQNAAYSGGNVVQQGSTSVMQRGVCWSTISNPDIADSHSIDGSGLGNFVSILSGLTPSTAYYLRAYATNADGTAYGDEVSFSTPLFSGTTDIDGNVYTSVILGTQEWFVENLRTSKYTSGDPIPNVTSDSQWNSLVTGAWCWYENNNQFENPFGKMYNWYAVADSRHLCPVGWHVPTKAEWTELSNYLGGESEAGGKMKETGTTNWISPNTGATNASGFTGLPSGYRLNFGLFGGIGSDGLFWSKSSNGVGNAWYFVLYYGDGSFSSNYDYQQDGWSVRCLKD
jgi:uncharacterized protein (TIGR02145 family)